MITVGFERAICAHVGQQIGKGDVLKAKLYHATAQKLIICMLIFVSLTFYLFKLKILAWFSDDEEILKLAGSVMWLQCLNCFPDGFKSLQKGVIRALGLQYLAVYANFLGHWVLNLSVTYFLVFYLKIGV